MKKVLTVLLVLVSTLVIGQSRKPVHKVKKVPRYYYDSLGVRRNWDSTMDIVIKSVIDTMKCKGYIKDR